MANLVADALSRRYVLFTILATFHGFEHIKNYTLSDLDFSVVFVACEANLFEKVFNQDGFFFLKEQT